ncbi:hypothetical protein IW136_006060, partial [Coemansia sp. RSA 678]
PSQPIPGPSRHRTSTGRSKRCDRNSRTSCACVSRGNTVVHKAQRHNQFAQKLAVACGRSVAGDPRTQRTCGPTSTQDPRHLRFCYWIQRPTKAQKEAQETPQNQRHFRHRTQHPVPTQKEAKM